MIDLINQHISKNITLIVLCQVPPGFTRSLKRNKDFLYYQVETLVFGRAIERALKPERIIVGCKDNNHIINEKYNNFLKLFNCPILPMIYESAELAKTAINIVLAAQVSTANSLSEICELSEGDWNEIIPALNLDKRIGFHAYLKPGLGISGGNIERDLNTVSKILNKVGGNNIFLDSIINYSSYRKKWASEVFKNKINHNKQKVSILGLSYKTNTNSIKNSPSIELIKELVNYDVFTYDPLIKNIKGFSHVKMASSLLESVSHVDVIFIMVPCEEFKQLNTSKFVKYIKDKSIIDPDRIIDNSLIQLKNHFVLGKN